MTVLLFGPPGAGKSTQADLLSRKYNFVKFSMGDILREEVAAKTPLGKKIEKHIDGGVLVPDDLVFKLVLKFLDEHKDEDLLFEGFPRTIRQALSLDECLSQLGSSVSLALEIHLDEEDIFKRLTNRGYCPTCGAIYNFTTNPPKKDQLCDNCNQHLVTRSDDSEEIIRKRLKVYADETQKIAQHYDTPQVYRRINARGSQQEIFEKISNIIDAYCSKE